jgi:hypothetical protein
MTHSNQHVNPVPASRREFLRRSGMGMAMFGLSGIMVQEGLLSPAAASTGFTNPMSPKTPHFRARAKRVIHLFMNGGPSHVDTFDPKPALERYAGKSLPNHLKTERETAGAFPSPFKFRKYGQCGLDVADIFSHVGEHADDLCVIRSMYANVPNHEPSLMLMNCGDQTLPRPAMGSWFTYGLGSENDNLPGFIAMCPGGYPTKGAENWRSAFLPGVYQGTYIDTKHNEIDKLIENVRNKDLSQGEQRRTLDFMQSLNRMHLEQRGGGDAALESRIASYELAYRMQMEATDAFDITREPQYIRDAYNADKSVQARQILIARRLIERGVRYVQVWHGAGQPWDNHDEIEKQHAKLAGECSQAIGALLADLKARGLLDETLVLWGGEFGRTPTVELPKKGANAGKINGRDHNHHGFTVWMAGGGVKPGKIYGATDEFGFAAVEDRMHVHDLHATMLHLLGFDHEKLTYRFAGRDFRLTDIHGNVVRDLIA